ncbi:MAG: Lpg1974 family pore-forming outer membrane protein [Parachlamydiales bacterium]|jgi:hypothetical protein
MEIMKKFLPILLAALATSTINANQSDSESIPLESDCIKCDSCCDVPNKTMTAAYNQADGIYVCNPKNYFLNNSFATISFLYIQPIQEQMETALRLFSPATSSNVLYKYDFEWKPAFKLGFGSYFDRDRWEAFIEYSRVNTSMHNSVSLGNSGGYLQDFWSFGNVGFNFTTQKVNTDWDLNFNIFHLDLGRSYYNGKKLVFNAHYGLKTGWINQKLQSESKGISLENQPIALKADFKSNSWLIGPRIGIYSHWMFCKGFRFFGNGSASLFYQKFSKIKLREGDVGLIPGTGEWEAACNYSTQLINSSLEGILGFGYERYINRNKCHFDLAVGYEAQLFFDQNMMRYLQQSNNHGIFSSSLKISSKAGNLIFHGLNITARLDF